MKASLKTKITLIIGFSIIILSLLVSNVNIQGSINYSMYFDQFHQGDLTGNSPNCLNCHTASPTSVQGSGSVTIVNPASVEAGIEFIVNVSITGFTEPADKPIAVGFSSIDGNNSALGNLADRLNDTAVLDPSGDLDVLFSFTIQTEGDYNLTALVLWADQSDNNKFHYLYENTSISVTPSADDTPPAINSVLLGNIEATNSSADLSESVLIKVNATDETGVKKVSLKVDSNDPIEMALNNVSNLYEYNLNTFFIPNGPFSLQIIAEDTLGNIATKTYTLNVLNTGVTGDITAWKMVRSEITIGDGIVDEFWDNINEFNVEEFSTDTTDGWIKASHDDKYLYVLVAYVADLPDYWIAFELDAVEESMVNGHDGWAFGSGHDDTAYFGDIYFRGNDIHPAIDSINDISFEKILTENDDIVYYEFKRPLITNDVDGKDMDFVEGQIYNIKFASSKPAFHKSGHREIHTFAISQSFPAGNGNPSTTTTSTNPRSPQQIKDSNIITFFIFAGLGLGLNISIIVIIYIFQRRKVL